MGYIESIKNKKGEVVSFKAIPYFEGKKLKSRNFKSRAEAEAFNDTQERIAQVLGGSSTHLTEKLEHLQKTIEKRNEEEKTVALYPTIAEAYLSFARNYDQKSTNYRNVIQQIKWWVNEIGHFRINEVNAELLLEKKLQLRRERTSRYLDQTTGKRKEVSFATVDRFVKALYTLYKYIRSPKGHLGKEGMGYVNIQTPRCPYTPTEKKLARPKRKRRLSFEEQAILLAAAKKDENPLIHFFIQLLIDTGGRWNEINRARWDQVDWIEGAIVLKDDDTKTDEGGRSLVLSRRYLRKLKAIKKYQQKNRITTPFIFAAPRQAKKRTYDFRTAMKKTIARSGLVDLRAHDLRHTFAYNYLSNTDAQLIDLAFAMGHRTHQTTLNYADIATSKKTRLAIESQTKSQQLRKKIAA